MRHALFSLLLLVSVFGSAIATANDNIAIDLSISGEIAPGVYGRVNIGDKHPTVVYEQPVIIKKVSHHSEPIYLHVPPGHAKHWDKHCAEYNACDRQVYFIKSHEYDDNYDNEKHSKKKHGNKHDRDDDEDEGEHGHSHGHGRD